MQLPFVLRTQHSLPGEGYVSSPVPPTLFPKPEVEPWHWENGFIVSSADSAARSIWPPTRAIPGWISHSRGPAPPPCARNRRTRRRRRTNGLSPPTSQSPRGNWTTTRVQHRALSLPVDASAEREPDDPQHLIHGLAIERCRHVTAEQRGVSDVQRHAEPPMNLARHPRQRRIVENETPCRPG